ncbi:5-methyltetrahydropteroyltriglutamate--homocysteine methyltransferase [Methanomicrobium sp. W14]|uniref:methionine synthase n=1 Tax=Methanomicrobium sp. W14 TaxID=2817839 RepID=UPI001AE67C3C|nr:methionine synthase [Methanomicrobium sp. W14]MBP2132902.1 5-methyltetrahydropteroyltriglutamate--homocysteine methyltransferase [Methanomicrobium sp. W14]
MKLINKIIPTTVVGSYPAVKSKGLKSFLDPYRQALETAVGDQIKSGIDIISTGQVRGDMITTLTSQIPGIRDQKVKGVIQPPLKPMTAEDTKYAVSRHNKVKAMLAGPSTISHALKIDTPLYRSRDELILDLAQIIAKEALNLESLGIAIFQIDEPILSTGIADMGTAYQAVSAITGALRVPTCIHVCGDIGKVIDSIIKMPVDIIDLEFSCNPENLETVSKKEFSGKQIGFGAVDSTSPEIDTVDEIKARIEKGIEIFGPEKLLIDPDCGLRMHKRDVAFKKLKNMVEAAGEVRRNLNE